MNLRHIHQISINYYYYYLRNFYSNRHTIHSVKRLRQTVRGRVDQRDPLSPSVQSVDWFDKRLVVRQQSTRGRPPRVGYCNYRSVVFFFDQFPSTPPSPRQRGRLVPPAQLRLYKPSVGSWPGSMQSAKNRSRRFSDRQRAASVANRAITPASAAGGLTRCPAAVNE